LQQVFLLPFWASGIVLMNEELIKNKLLK